MSAARKFGCALVLALAAVSTAAGSAGAAPVLNLALTRTTTPATHSDERTVYEITVGNTAPAQPAVGTELTCLGTPADGKFWFGEPTPTFTFQWVRNGQPIEGATSKTYTVVPADEGKLLQCVVAGENEPSGDLAISKVASQPPVVVAPAPAPAPPAPIKPTKESSRPWILLPFEGGEPVEAGKEITCKAPTEWVGTSIEWSFRWLVNGALGKGTATQTDATTSKYLVQAEDVPSIIQCEAIAKDAAGNEAISISTTEYTVPPPGGGNGPVNVPLDTPSVTFSNGIEGTVTVQIELPGGAETYALRVLGTEGTPVWRCTKQPPVGEVHATATCTRSDSLAPESAYPPIELVERPGHDAPDLLVTKVSVSGGGAPLPATAEDQFLVGPAVPFGFKAFETKVADEFGNDYTQAGGHPYSAGALVVLKDHVKAEHSAESGFRAANGFAKVVNTETPRGFIGNPGAIPETCASIADVVALPASTCPAGSAVGGITLATSQGPFENLPIFSITPEFGTPAEFGFGISSGGQIGYALTPELRADDGYAISLITAPLQKNPELFEASVTLCGFGAKVGINSLNKEAEFQGCKKAAEAGANEKPLITNPTRCSGPAPTTRISANTWEHPDQFASAEFTSPALTGCDAVQFEPQIKLSPTSHRADSPTGLNVDLTMPTEGLESPTGIAQANLANSTVTLPVGMALNPSVASGLDACSPAQVGLGTNDPITCPESSKVGSVEVETPLLSQPLKGSVYVAKQKENPFGSLLAVYLVFESKRDGIIIKVAGKVTPNPTTGQLTASFTENPEAPFSRLSLHFAAGNRAPLINPPMCGKYTIVSKLSPWTAADPGNPTPTETVTQNSSFVVNSGPGGGPCPTNALEPRMQAGLTSPVAGSTSPFVLNLSREDGTQRFSALSVEMPPGLTGYLKGIPYCPDSTLAAIPAAEGTAAAEVATPACPAASQLGTVTVGAGAGANPFYVNTGRAYLAGPYKGAPLSIAIVAPALAGPFDLGNVVVRNAARINPETAQITVVSDPVPTILHGLLLDVRDIRVAVDRPNFILAPTNCEPMAINAQVSGENGGSASVSNRFQVGECARLGFKPKLAIRLHGGTKRGDFQRLEATLTARRGDANTAMASVALPHSEFLEQGHIGTVCTRVQFAADNCPKGSIYGYARAQSPLVDYTLKGPVYLRSSSHLLPDLVAALRGPANQPIEVALAGRTDSLHGGIRNTFEVVPDAPVTKFRLELRGGQKSLIVNSRNICNSKQRAIVRLTAQNGRQRNFRPPIKNDCGKKKKKK
jgi:hypothetical protein